MFSKWFNKCFNIYFNVEPFTKLDAQRETEKEDRKMKIRECEGFGDISQASPRELPIVHIGEKHYYFDRRLSQLRNVNNPHDFKELNETEYLAIAAITC